MTPERRAGRRALRVGGSDALARGVSDARARPTGTGGLPAGRGLTRRLGRTDVELPELGLGCAPLGDLFEKLCEDVADATLRAAWESGIRFFDTAPHYGAGLSEHRLGRALRGVPPGEVVVSTKVGRVLRPSDAPDPAGRGPFVGGLPFEQEFDYGYDGVHRALEGSLQRLGRSRVDLVAIHDLDVRHHPDPPVLARHLDDLANGGAKALDELRAAGAIRAVGAGVNELGMIPVLLDRVELDYVILAMPYTLLDQEALDDELPLCADRGVGVIVGAVFASGILAAPPPPGRRTATTSPRRRSPSASRGCGRCAGGTECRWARPRCGSRSATRSSLR